VKNRIERKEKFAPRRHEPFGGTGPTRSGPREGSDRAKLPGDRASGQEVQRPLPHPWTGMMSTKKGGIGDIQSRLGAVGESFTRLDSHQRT